MKPVRTCHTARATWCVNFTSNLRDLTSCKENMLVPYRPQRSSGLPVFRGMTVQSRRGFGSALSGLFRNVVFLVASTVGMSLVRKRLKTASRVLSGLAEGKRLKRALLDETQTTRAQPRRSRKQRKIAKVNKRSKKRPIKKRHIQLNTLSC